MLTIACGCSDPDPKVEAKIVEARRLTPEPKSFTGCGRLVSLLEAFRCVTCGRWMHRTCLRQHFISVPRVVEQ